MDRFISSLDRQSRSLIETAPFLFLISLAWACPNVVEAQTFRAPDINRPAQQFSGRFNSRSVNVDFIVADVMGKVGRRLRGAENSAANDTERALAERNNEVDLDARLREQGVSAVADSVIVAPGADIKNLTVIDTGESTSIAIGR